MTFEPEGTESQGSPGQQPSIIPEAGTLQRQKVQGKVDTPNTKVTSGKKSANETVDVPRSLHEKKIAAELRAAR
jgi:hypothetical protein